MSLALHLSYQHQTSDDLWLEVPVGIAQEHITQAEHLSAGTLKVLGQPVLYAWLLLQCDLNPLYVRFMQAILATINCLLILSLGRVLFSVTSGRIASLIAILYGPFLYLAGELQSAIFITFLVLATVRTLLWAVSRQHPIGFIVPGTTLALGLAVGYHILPLLAIGLGWIWYKQRPSLGASIVFILMPILALASGTSAAFSLAETVSIFSPMRLYLCWQGFEITGTISAYAAMANTTLFNLLLWQHGIAFPFGIIAPIALVGLGILNHPRYRSPESMFLSAFIGATWIAAAASGSNAVSRAPLAALSLIIAAETVRSLAILSWKQRRWGLCCLVVLMWLSNRNSDMRLSQSQAVHHYCLGYIYEKLDMNTTAMRAYEKAIETQIDNRRPYYALVDLYDRNGETAQSIGVLRDLIKQWPQDDSARVSLADHYMMARRPQQALTAYTEALTQGAAPDAVLGRLGDARLSSGDLNGATEAYQDLLNISPDSSRVRYQLAQVQTRKGHLTDAIKTYKQLLLDPLWTSKAGPKLAELYVLNQQFEKAENLLVKLLEQESDNQLALWSQGVLFFRQKRHEESLVCFERLQSLSPNDHGIYFFLSKLYGRLQKESKAQWAFNRYTTIKQRTALKKRMESEKNLLLKNILGEEL